jgi:7,8-dihydroneopterin aldolase/epimerase/oxygenase
MLVHMWQINIVNAQVEAKHGLFPEEKILGQTFVVNISIDFNASNIEYMNQTIDYVFVYNIMLEEMQKPTPLLEQVVERIANKLIVNIALMQSMKICIKKLNPLFAKQLEATEVCYSWYK